MKFPSGGLLTLKYQDNGLFYLAANKVSMNEINSAQEKDKEETKKNVRFQQPVPTMDINEVHDKLGHVGEQSIRRNYDKGRIQGDWHNETM